MMKKYCVTIAEFDATMPLVTSKTSKRQKEKVPNHSVINTGTVRSVTKQSEEKRKKNTGVTQRFVLPVLKLNKEDKTGKIP
jgi:hypothetical protein